MTHPPYPYFLYDVGLAPSAVAVEDLNGDGYPYQYGIRTMTVFDNKLILGTATASEEGCKVFEASAK